MKYYIGRLAVFNEDYESQSDACIVAADDTQALALLRSRAQCFVDADCTLDADGCYRFDGYDVLAVRATTVHEISPAAFHDMRELLPVFGDVGKGALLEESTDERVKTLARRIGNQLARLGTMAPHGKLLRAVAASIGEADWQVLVHKDLDAVAPAASKDRSWPDNGDVQPYIPGTGYLYRVPVTVDTTMTAVLKVRARDEAEAALLARRFAQDGNARFEVDDGNYRGLADHYVGDSSELERLDDLERPAPMDRESDTAGVQRGAYLVGLSDIGDGPEAMLYADLSVFFVDESEPLTESCMSSVPATAPADERRAFCVRIAELMQRAAPDETMKSWQSLTHAFVAAAQGDTSDEAYAALEATLKTAR